MAAGRTSEREPRVPNFFAAGPLNPKIAATKSTPVKAARLDEKALRTIALP